MSNHTTFNNQFLLEQFEKIVLQYTNKTALVYEQQSLSYSALNNKVNQTARFIVGHGIKPGTIIGLFTDRSIEMVIGYLAILKAGCIVAPLDSSDLSERQTFILQDTALEHILTQKYFAMHFSQAGIVCNFIYLDTPSIATLPTENLYLKNHLHNPAIIIYTSGSSGQPKGVMISHSNLCYYTQALQQNFNMTAGDSYLHKGDISLIVSARQLLMPLSIGATVVIATQKQIKQPLELLKAIKAHNVTIFDHVPSFWKSLALLISQLSDQEKFNLFDLKVRMVVIHGEAFKSNIAQFLFDHFKPNTVFKNVYGQTEGTGVVSSYTITKNDLELSAFIPIGKAMPHMQITIVNDALLPVNENETGEILIAGDGVAIGYHNRDQLTQERFLTIAALDANGNKMKAYRTGDLGRYCKDGNIEFLGRIDNQVNIYGRRIDLDEIQNTLTLHPQIDDAQVIVHEDVLGIQTILAYIIPSATGELDADEIRQFLLKKLPQYLTPSKYILLHHFPLTSSGKMNRQALHSTDYTQLSILKKQTIAPISDLQQHLKAAWEKTLETPNINLTDDFFNLGGDSLKGVELVLAVEKLIGHPLPIQAVEQLSTIAHMADAIDANKHLTQQVDSNSLSHQQYKTMRTILSSCGIPTLNQHSLLLTINLNGQKPPLFWCFNAPGHEMVALAKKLPIDQPLYGLLSSVPLDSSPETLLKVASHYVDELLTRYPNGPFILGGNCRGAKVICEMYHLLKQKNIPIHKICLLEFFHPWLYEFDGDLMLLFGEQSHLQRHKLLKWNERNWEKPFIKTPEVHWINCQHGKFFNSEHINTLASKVNQLIAC